MAKSIAEHLLVRQALDGLLPYIAKDSPARIAKRIPPTGPMRVKKPRGFPLPATRYQHVVFDRATKVASDFESLDQIVSMVRRFPTRRTLSKWKMSGDQWLQYLYTIYLVTVVGAIDRCLQVVNAVLRLGLDYRDCSEHILLRHSRVQSTRLAAAIKKLVAEVQSTRAHRNLDVHRKDLPPFYEIVGWAGYDWLPAYALLERTNHSLMDPDLLHRGFGYSGKLLALKMQKEKTRMKARVSRLFDLLVPVARREAQVLALWHRASNKALRPALARPQLDAKALAGQDKK